MAGYPPVPSKFIALQDVSGVSPETRVNIIGIVTDLLPTRKTAGTSYQLTFKLSDYTNDTSEYGQLIKFFQDDPSKLPPIRGIGDVVLLRSVNQKHYQGQDLLMSHYSTRWAVFHHVDIPNAIASNSFTLPCEKHPQSPPVSQVELAYIFHLCNSRDRLNFGAALNPPSDIITNAACTPVNKGKEKFRLIQDLQHHTFADLVGQIVKIYPNGSHTELYISDYTSNGFLFDYRNDVGEYASRDGDEYGYIRQSTKTSKWKGPFGKLTLAVTLWPPHDQFVIQNIKEEQFAFLRNVHIKYRDGRLEGVLHTDRLHPDKVDISIVKDWQVDERTKNILRRKREYEQTLAEQSRVLKKGLGGTKRKKGPDEEREEPRESTVDKEYAQQNEQSEQLSKNQKKKRRKLERKAMEQTITEANADKKQGGEIANAEKPRDPPEERPCFKKQIQINPNIRHTRNTHRARSIVTILDTSESHAYITPRGKDLCLPFINTKYRTSALRVMGFFPPKLEDFAIRKHVSEFDCLSDDGKTSRDNGFASESQPSSDDEAEEVNDIDSSISENGGSACGRSPRRKGYRWEWRFALLLEDAIRTPEVRSSGTTSGKPENRQIWALVSGADADFLTQMSARNFRRAPKKLAQLREKLFILWGDLEERAMEGIQQTRVVGHGEKPPKALPFECCLMEYGVRERNHQMEEDCRGKSGVFAEPQYTRRWKIFDTKIV
ncbi:hypothetical protein MMC25_008332 [Agyrium rufum]|nr:hypothetical protein [Agyrium rufum]